MKSFKHNPHPIDHSDVMYGHFNESPVREESKEKKKEETTHQDKLIGSVLSASVSKLRQSVSQRLFSMELGNITF